MMRVVWREQWRWWHGDGDGDGTERAVAVAQRGWQQWHIEGGRIAWAACHSGLAACWGCEVHTVGGWQHVDGVHGWARCAIMCRCVSGQHG